jgi:hypothetical protein
MKTRHVPLIREEMLDMENADQAMPVEQYLFSGTSLIRMLT